MALIKKFTPQNSDQFIKEPGDQILGKFGHLNYLLRQINSSLLNFTPGSVLFSDSNGDPAGDPTQFYWDDVNNRLGIGTATPTSKLQVSGTFSSSLDATINGVTFGKGGGSISNNVAAGQSALLSNTTGSQNVAIGFNAMTLSTGANCNVAIGNNALQSMTGIGFNANIVAIGHNVMNTKTGLIDSNNVVIGSNAMADGGGTGGQNNVAIGTQSMRNNQTGIRNISIGFQTMRNPTTSSNNVALGVQALHNVSTGGANIGLGNTAGFNITTGSNNVVIGATFATSIATLSNFMLFCDGAGTERFRVDDGGRMGIGATAINPSAKVQIDSTTQGFLPPRMTGAQVLLIASPAEGLMVYATSASGAITSKGWWGYNGATWIQLG